MLACRPEGTQSEQFLGPPGASANRQRGQRHSINRNVLIFGLNDEGFHYPHFIRFSRRCECIAKDPWFIKWHIHKINISFQTPPIVRGSQHAHMVTLIGPLQRLFLQCLYQKYLRPIWESLERFVFRWISCFTTGPTLVWVLSFWIFLHNHFSFNCFPSRFGTFFIGISFFLKSNLSSVCLGAQEFCAMVLTFVFCLEWDNSDESGTHRLYVDWSWRYIAYSH